MYANIDDMTARFGIDALLRQAADADGALDAEAVSTALRDAAELAESHIAGRYKLPLSPVPAPVKRWCADMAFYYLHRYEPAKDVRQRHEDALAGLRAVARGEATLQCAGVEAPAPGAEAGGGTVRTSGPVRMFDAHGLKGF